MAVEFTRVVLAILLAHAAFGQVFDVASIKPSAGERNDFRIYPGGRLRILGWSLDQIMREAYGLEPYQIAGGPSWMATAHFDVEAKSEGDSTKEQVLAMLRTLLADRFHLRFRREAKEHNVYTLLVAAGGYKLDFPDRHRECRQSVVLRAADGAGCSLFTPGS